MLSARSSSLAARLAFAGAAAFFAVGAASAQTAPASHSSEDASAWSSSVDGQPLDGSSAAEPAAPALSAGGQYDNRSGATSTGGVRSHLAFEAGGGFNAPTNDSSPYISWGGNLTLGVGYRFSRAFTLMADYQFIDDKLPGAVIAQTGASGGNAHIWSFTLSPVIDLFPHSSNGVYVTGGGGFYRKVTNFTDPQPTQYCTYYYCGIGYTTATIGHFSSNQGGWNVGAGFRHRFAGMYGDGKAEVFAEARYLDVMSPAEARSPNGLGVVYVGADTKLIPVTFGVRF